MASAFPQFAMAAGSAKLLTADLACSHPWSSSAALLAGLLGSIFRYVDDVVGISTLVSAHHDDSVVNDIITKTFGPDSVAEDKHVPEQTAVILGWQISTRSNEIRPSDRGIRKLTFASFSFDTSKPQPLALRQRLASLAQRYSAGLIGTADFVRPLVHMWVSKEKASCREATSNAKFVVEMWRIFCIRLWRCPSAFTTSIEVFANYRDTESSLSRVAISDASTPRVAVGIYDQSPDGSLTFVAWTGYNFPFLYKDEEQAKKFQHHREFLGLLLSLILHASLMNSLQATQSIFL